MDLTMRHGEDLLLSACFITNCEKIVYLNEGLYFYRDRPGSAIHSFRPERKESVKAVHTEMEKLIEKWEMPELTPLHNARKVNGWITNLILLMKNKRNMSAKEYREQIRSMSRDPYFCQAYAAMDHSQLPCVRGLLKFFSV